MFTNSHLIHTLHYQNGVVSFPDVTSYRYNRRRYDGYRLRCYWQFKQTFDQNKMAVFDTLTYDDAHLPKFNDKACFRYKDIKMFLDRLHARMSYRGFGSFKHFIVSEYGKDELYLSQSGKIRKGTKRPHYHCLFFLDSQIDSVEFARMVHDCWQCGRTDNYGSYYGERSRDYVLHNTFTSGSVDKCRHLKLSAYVAKYVLKNQKYKSSLVRSIRAYVRSIHHDLNLSDSVDRKVFNMYVNDLYRTLSEFVCVSHGFGDYALEECNLDMEKIMTRNIMDMPDSKLIVRHIPLPEYYARKLFYKHSKDGCYRLNEKGREWYKNKCVVACKNLEKHYSDCFSNLSYDSRFDVLHLLSGRSFGDLAKYVVYYRGRVIDKRLIDSMPSIDEIVSRYVVADDDEKDLVYNDCIPEIKYHYEKGCRTFWEVYDQMHFSYKSFVPVLKREIKRYDWKDDVIDDSWFEDFYSFDDVLKILDSFASWSSLNDDSVFHKKEDLVDLFGGVAI